MLKKLCLSAVFTLLPFATLIPSVDHIANIHNIIEHIDQQIKSIVFEAKTVLILKHKAEDQYRHFLQDEYESVKQKCIHVLGTIAASPEFAITLEEVTQEQMVLIVEQMIHYNDILIDSSAYPLEQKLNDALALAAFDEQTEQLFNVLYVTYAIARGSRLLLEKLEIKRNELIVELEVLHASDEALDAQIH